MWMSTLKCAAYKNCQFFKTNIITLVKTVRVGKWINVLCWQILINIYDLKIEGISYFMYIWSAQQVIWSGLVGDLFLQSTAQPTNNDRTLR